MSKAAAAFRTISEVADELKVPKHVLRFWELKFTQLKPMKRGGGRRYYRPEDLELLRGIRHLLHADGYTIKGVQKILREQGVEAAKTAPLKELDQPAKSTAGGTGARAKSEKTTARGKRVAGGVKGKRGARGSGGTRERSGSEKSAALELPDKSVKALERAIKELKLCRDVLRGKPAGRSARSGRAAPSKARRARASR